MKILLLCGMLFRPPLALASESGGHLDPVGGLALALVIILVVAKLGGDLAVRLGQPAVLGELIGGILVGTFPLLGISDLEWLKTDPYLDMLARIGVLILLFEVGLIFANIGAALTIAGHRVISNSTFSAVVVMVIMTTMATPPALKWSLGRLRPPRIRKPGAENGNPAFPVRS